MEEFLTFGSFGEEASDTISAQVINAFFDELHLPAVYMPFPADDNNFITALPVLRSKFSGFNVTSEYKLEITDHLDRLEKSARNTGAVTTVKTEGGKLSGYNTDQAGFERSLQGFVDDLNGKSVLLTGAGGTAYAAADVLLKYGAVVSLFSSEPFKINLLRTKLEFSYGEKRIKAAKAINETDKFFMIVNAESSNNSYAEMIPQQVYQKINCAYDINFGVTPFLRKALDAGVKTKDGFDMIFFKSIETIKIWFEKTEITEDVILKVYNMIRAENITA